MSVDPNAGSSDKSADDIDELLDRIDRNDAKRAAALKDALGMEVESIPVLERGESTVHPLADEQRWCVTLADGRVIALEQLHQYRVYAGVLAGAPRDVEHDLSSALARAKKLFPYYKVPAVMLVPQVSSGSFPEREDEKFPMLPWMVLPKIACIAEFKSGEPARDKGECFSSLVVVWYQERLGLPDDGRTLAQLQNIDWKNRAWDWTP